MRPGPLFLGITKRGKIELNLVVINNRNIVIKIIQPYAIGVVNLLSLLNPTGTNPESATNTEVMISNTTTFKVVFFAFLSIIAVLLLPTTPSTVAELGF